MRQNPDRISNLHKQELLENPWFARARILIDSGVSPKPTQCLPNLFMKYVSLKLGGEGSNARIPSEYQRFPAKVPSLPSFRLRNFKQGFG